MPFSPEVTPPPLTLSDVLRAALLARVYDVAHETPLEYAPVLSHRLGNRVLLKREDLQPVFSFKIRGAANKIAHLSERQLDAGVICASAGNHAQGVALASQRRGVHAVVVMPITTPRIKVDAVVRMGADVRLVGDSYDDANTHAQELAREHGFTFVHPYDDADVIAGQATIALELLKQHPDDLHAVFVAVGGGGLISGVGAILKVLRPSIRVIGVETEDADAFARSRAAGERIRLDRVGRFADGVAVRQVGETTWALAQQVVDETLVVSNDAVCAAMKDIFEDRRAILEPAGALAFAGLKAWCQREGARDQTLVAIACGANVNFDSLRHVSERAEIGERREAVFAVTIPERPGSFREFCAVVGDHAVTEFNYRYSSERAAHVYVGVRVVDDRQANHLQGELRLAGYDVVDLTDNETAKLHIRHLVGGHAPVQHERILSFVFPERAGALGQFLDAMQHPWNISLFHYRNHGSDYGRVLAGVQVPPDELDNFQSFLTRLGYDCTDETDNPACNLFLR